MLIGPTLTLGELESHMETKVNDNKMKLNKLGKEYAKLQQELQATPKMDFDEKSGEQVVNPRYLKVIDEGTSIAGELEDLNNQNEFIAKRIGELDSIEDRSFGKVDKAKNKITLTLNDCLMLGIELDGADEE